MMDGPGGDYADPIVLPFSITIPDPRPVVNCGMSRLAPVVNHPANGWPEDRPTEDWSLDTILGFAAELFGTPSARADEVPPEERAEEDERRDLEEEKGPDIFDPFPVPRVTAPGGPRIGHMPGALPRAREAPKHYREWPIRIGSLMGNRMQMERRQFRHRPRAGWNQPTHKPLAAQGRRKTLV
jgi:hypothetical protein